MLYYVYSSVAEQLEFDWSIKESTAFKEANCKQRGSVETGEEAMIPTKDLKQLKWSKCNQITL